MYFITIFPLWALAWKLNAHGNRFLSSFCWVGFSKVFKKKCTPYMRSFQTNQKYQRDKIRISIVFRKKNKSKKSTVGFSVEIERPWESFISKISSLTLCSMTISSYVLFISPPIYIEGRLRQGCSLKTCGRAGSRQEDNTLGRCGNIGWPFYSFRGVKGENRNPTIFNIIHWVVGVPTRLHVFKLQPCLSLPSI